MSLQQLGLDLGVHSNRHVIENCHIFTSYKHCLGSELILIYNYNVTTASM